MPGLISSVELEDDGKEEGLDPAPDAVDLDAVRELVLRAHPDVVPELVAGESIASLLASVEPAREAYARLAGAIRETVPQAPVPAGGGAVLAVDPDSIPAAEMIRRGLVSAQARREG